MKVTREVHDFSNGWYRWIFQWGSAEGEKFQFHKNVSYFSADLLTLTSPKREGGCSSSKSSALFLALLGPGLVPAFACWLANRCTASLLAASSLIPISARWRHCISSENSNNCQFSGKWPTNSHLLFGKIAGEKKKSGNQKRSKKINKLPDILTRKNGLLWKKQVFSVYLFLKRKFKRKIKIW